MCLRGFVVLFFGLVFLLPVASLPSLAPSSSIVPIACASILPAHVQNASLEKPALGSAASAPRASVPLWMMAGKHVFTRAKIQDKNTTLSLGGSGNAGIGTASPASMLSVGGAGLAGVTIYGTGSSTTATQGTIYGVNSSTTTGNGVFGAMSAANNTGSGVMGTNIAGTGINYGGYFTNTNDHNQSAAIYANESGAGAVYGVYGIASAGTSAVNVGVYGQSASANTGYGVEGQVAASSNTGYGVYGINSGTTNTGAGGYFTNTGGGYALITGTGNVGIVSTNPDFQNAPPRIDAG